MTRPLVGLVALVALIVVLALALGVVIGLAWNAFSFVTGR